MNKENNDEKQRLPTEEGRLVVSITKALFKNDVDETFRILGGYLDKHKLQVSADVIGEYEASGRIRRH